MPVPVEYPPLVGETLGLNVCALMAAEISRSIIVWNILFIIYLFNVVEFKSILRMLFHCLFDIAFQILYIHESLNNESFTIYQCQRRGCANVIAFESRIG